MNYNYIKDQIRQKPVDPPTNCTAGDMSWWLIGYQNCLQNVMDVLTKLQEENERP